MVRIGFLRNNSLTLLEILIVTIIIGILSTLGFVNYARIKEDAIDKEARSNLKLIQAAEKIYRVETNRYYPASGGQSDIDTINNKLKLSLPSGSTRNWNYRVWSTGCSRATRNGGDGRSWFLTINDSDGEPDKGAGCP